MPVFTTLSRKNGSPESPEGATLSDWLAADRQTRQAALSSCLERIPTTDAAIQAWLQVLPQHPTNHGSLSDIPFGVKDIIETRGLSTEYGSPVYKGRIGEADAAIVQDLRTRGAVLLGKTHSTAFAWRDPAPTRNPRSLEHTPGGSSSGSAAAVAAGMVPFALGTQTLGSVLRPASYCGVTGFKPTYGVYSLDGVLPLATSLDTLGFFTHTPTDMLLLWETLGQTAGPEEGFAFSAPDPLPDVDAEMASAFHAAISSLRKAGISIRPLDIAPMLVQLAGAAEIVLFYEGARLHEQRFNEHGDRLGQVAALVREGLRIPIARYEEARQYISQSRTRIIELYQATPIVLVPAATGPAPRGLAFTGDPRMNSPWTALGTPAITVPLPVGDRLPLGLQLTAAPGADGPLLRAAMRIYGILTA